ncbi:MAG: sensor histidine kinase [Candidatus Dormiibacterota bacterium]
MTPRGAARLAWCLSSIGLVLGVGAAALAVANRGSIHSVEAANPLEIVMSLSFAVVGGLIASRRTRNPVGWLFLFMAVVMGAGGVAAQYARLAVYTVPGAGGAQWALWWSSFSEQLVYPAGAATLTLLLIPDGRLPSYRWRPVIPIAVVTTLLLVIAVGALGSSPLDGPDNQPQLANPLAVEALVALQGPLGYLWFVGMVILLVGGAAPLVRLRRARGEEREQLKWIAYVVVTTVVATLVVVGVSLVAPQASVVTNNALLAINISGFAVGLPVAIGIAVFKYRLYDIDIIISRTIVYGSLAVFITAVYVGIAVGIGALVGGGGKPNLALSVVATAIVAIGFQPVRERVQKVANRLVYGKRATPYEVLSEFSGQVAETYAADEVLPRMARVLQEGTGAESATVWLRGVAELRPAATFPNGHAAHPAVPMRNGMLPELDGQTRAVEVRHQGELLGALSVSKRRGEALTPIEQKLVDDLAHQAGLVLKNVGLTQDLQARLDELRASRQRLVSAQDLERRRLERNLHDGAQQHLVALKVKLGLAEMLLGRDPERAATTLVQLKADADDALETLRDLARGIYPPLLADKGLVVALESQARKATVAVSIEASGIERYSQDVEATVYFCVLEALQNVQKYANASHVVVDLHFADGALHFDVTDDGDGFDASTMARGSGLTNMADRLDALGGSVEVTSHVGSGTSVRGSLPVQARGPAAGSPSPTRSQPPRPR